jgi:hypothetical protein
MSETEQKTTPLQEEESMKAMAQVEKILTFARQHGLDSVQLEVNLTGPDTMLNVVCKRSTPPLPPTHQRGRQQRKHPNVPSEQSNTTQQMPPCDLREPQSANVSSSAKKEAD